MIFGNPDSFAVYLDKIDSWSDNSRETNGITGIYINKRFFLTNFGLISFNNEFGIFLNNSNNLQCDQSAFDLGDIELLKFMIMERYPNWYANSEEEWETNLDAWKDCDENHSFDLSLESFFIGHIERFYLFGLKSSDNYIKLIFYIKNDSKDFFDFSVLNSFNIESVILKADEYGFYINEIKSYLSKIGINYLSN